MKFDNINFLGKVDKKRKITNALVSTSLVAAISGCSSLIPKTNSDNWNEFCDKNKKSLVCNDKKYPKNTSLSYIDFEIKKENNLIKKFEIDKNIKYGEFFKSRNEKSEKRKKIKKVYDSFFSEYKYKVDSIDKWEFIDNLKVGDCEDFALTFTEELLKNKVVKREDIEVHFGYLIDNENNKKFYHSWVIIKDNNDEILYDSGFDNMIARKFENKYFIMNKDSVFYESEQKLW